MTDGRQKEGGYNGKEDKMVVVEPSMSTNKHMVMDITFLFTTFLFAMALSTVFFIKVYYLVYQCVMYLLGCVQYKG